MSRPVIFFLLCSASALTASSPDAVLARAKDAMAQTPLRFEANQGQWEPAVRFAARSAGYSLLLTDRGPVFSLPDARRMEIRLLRANPAPEIEALDHLRVRTNYFLGSRSQWRSGISSYARVRYRGVYRGIDLIYYGDQNQLEYDFVLQLGADPRSIRLQFRGADRLSITKQGDLEVDAGGAHILQRKPYIYQETAAGRRPVTGGYMLLGRNRVGLRLAAYDRTETLVIDPVLVYSTYMGGTASDQITAVKLGAKGSLYIAGSTATSDLPTTEGVYSGSNSGLTDIFVAIVDTTASGAYGLTYLTYLGGANLDVPLAMDIDKSGNIYLTGTTTSTNFPTTGNAVQTTGGSTTQAFVVQLNPAALGNDSLVYSTYLGGTTGINSGNGIAAGSDGMIYVIGTTRATDFPVTASAYAAVLYGPQDAFLCKIDPAAGSLIYSTYLGSELADDGRGIAVDKNNLVYFGITTNGTQFPLAGASYISRLIGNFDIILGVMDMTKSGVDSLLYDTYFGGTDSEEVRKLGFDAKGNLLVTGYTLSSDFPVTPDALQHNYAGNGDVFVSVISFADPSNINLYSTYLGGSDGEVAYDIAADSAGSIYVTGYTLSGNFPVTRDAAQSQWGNGINAFLTKFQPGKAGSGAIQYSTFFGPAGISVANALAVGPDGTVYAGGYTTKNFPVTGNAMQPNYGGGYTDGFVLAVK